MFDKNKIINEAHDVLRNILLKFCENPYLFFNEIGLLHYIFAEFYNRDIFRELHETNDKKKTNILHPEYGSYYRMKNKNKRKYRGWYDLVILNPEFIKRNIFRRVTSNYEDENKKTQPSEEDILIALEFKFIRNKSKTYLEQLKKDYDKLKNGKECEKRYMIIFSLIDEKNYNYFNEFKKHYLDNLLLSKEFKWNDDIRLVFCLVYFDKQNKKCITYIAEPNDFLNLSEHFSKHKCD